MVAAQNSTAGDSLACTTCLQSSLQALPLCQGLNITTNAPNSTVTPAYAACLCSSMNGTWIDACADPTKCGPDILAFKAQYPDTLTRLGLQCNGTTPTFAPPTADPVLPTSAVPTGSTPTGVDGKASIGHMDAVPSALFTKIMGALAVAAAVGAGLI
ncbi:hypothetical protein BGZ99_010094 [Dissophora globulifera]|uniref:Uncharacterized protein n=1 Tax=Dissophora globulifera TaxID=979702 RepID=A0A9P6RSW2_9FUNG|nr:hypothetical protein BGZ99_010094 [Dissophora globulifera]